MTVETLLIYKDKSILDALEKLNKILYSSEVSRLILFVIDEDKKVLGSLTDGDIRRALVRNADINQKVSEVCNPEFVFEYKRDGYLDLKAYRKKDIKILPILNKERQLLNIVDLEKTKALLPVECMIMAGGRGKRLSPITDTVPKPMLPLGDKPIIEHNIDRLISYGIQKIYISIKYLGDQIRDYFGDGSEKGIKIEYIEEDEPLGTAGALSLVNKFKSDHILLLNSDLFTNVNFEELYLNLIEKNAQMVIASTEYKVDVPYAVFDSNENKEISKFREKPSYVYHSNAGIYMFDKSLISRIPKNEFFDITTLMENVLREGGKLLHNPIIGYWIDIGSPADYKQAQEFVKHLN
jgi:dTDP-glucose pyrophosphorylase/CBS domain-containing protein